MAIVSAVTLAWSLLTAITHVQGTANPYQGQNCDCYRTGGNTGMVYAGRRLSDFRNISTAGDGYDTSNPPPLPAGDQGTESPANAYLTSAPFTNDWTLQNWSKDVQGDTTVKMVNSPANFYVITPQPGAETYLTLRTHRSKGFQSAAETEGSIKNLHHASMRFRARVRGDAGGVAGMFTYQSEDNESDIEILTRDPDTQIRYSNQPQVDKAGNYVDASENDKTLPDHWSWRDWHTHRMDWVSGLVSWYIDDINIVNNTYSVPKVGMTLTMNMWSDGGTWSSVMSVDNQAFLDLAWVDLIYNTTDTKGSLTCSNICDVDSADGKAASLIYPAPSNTGTNDLISIKLSYEHKFPNDPGSNSGDYVGKRTFTYRHRLLSHHRY